MDHATDTTMLDQAREIAALLREALPPSVDAAEQGIQHKPIFYALVARETLLHRTCALADDALALADVGREVSAAILARSMIETMALLGYMLYTLEKFHASRDATKFYERIVRIGFGSRQSTDIEPKPIHVNDAIKEADARLPVSGLASLYASLCEFTHPNWGSGFGSFGTHLNALRVEFGGEARCRPALGANLAIILDSFNYLYNRVGDEILTASKMLDEPNASAP